MLTKRYLELLNELKDLNSKTEIFLKEDPEDNFEEMKAHSIIKYLHTEIGEAIHELEHLNREVKEGLLYLNSQGRYNLDTMPEFYFTCGNIIELAVEGQWQSGRVEHDDKDYYFCSYEGKNIPLREGMKARIRVDKL